MTNVNQHLHLHQQTRRDGEKHSQSQLISQSTRLERELDAHPRELIREVPEHVWHRNSNDLPTTTAAAPTISASTSRTGDATNPTHPPRPPSPRAPDPALSYSRRCRGGALSRRSYGAASGGGGQEGPAGGADVRHVSVGAVHEAIVEKEGGPVAEEGITLHLSEADAALVLAALDRLPRELVDRARCSHLWALGLALVVSAFAVALMSVYQMFMTQQ